MNRNFHNTIQWFKRYMKKIAPITNMNMKTKAKLSCGITSHHRDWHTPIRTTSTDMNDKKRDSHSLLWKFDLPALLEKKEEIILNIIQDYKIIHDYF